jgi:hypothetical protein
MPGDLDGPWTITSPFTFFQQVHLVPILCILSHFNHWHSWLEFIDLNTNLQPLTVALTVALAFDQHWLSPYPCPLECVNGKVLFFGLQISTLQS